jgi:hypothetical protein
MTSAYEFTLIIAATTTNSSDSNNDASVGEGGSNLSDASVLEVIHYGGSGSGAIQLIWHTSWQHGLQCDRQ